MYCAIKNNGIDGEVGVLFTSDAPLSIDGVKLYPFIRDHYDPSKGLLGAPKFYLRNESVFEVLTYFPHDYVQQRKSEYPPIGDQLDALWKLIQANSDKIDLGEAAPLLAVVQEVKDKYPKAP
jgi:hypothetical protein